MCKGFGFVNVMTNGKKILRNFVPQMAENTVKNPVILSKAKTLMQITNDCTSLR